MDTKDGTPQNFQRYAAMEYGYCRKIWEYQREQTKNVWKTGENHCMKQSREAMNFQYQQKSTSLFVQFMK